MTLLAANTPPAYVIILQETDSAESRSLMRFADGEYLSFCNSPSLAKVLDASSVFLERSEFPLVRSQGTFRATVKTNAVRAGRILPIVDSEADEDPFEG